MFKLNLGISRRIQKTIKRGVMEIKTEFNIEGIICEIKPLKMRQIVEVSDLIGTMELKEIKGFKDIVEKLTIGSLSKLMTIIFGEKNIDWLEVDYEIIDEVIENFFVLNPRLKTRLVKLLNFLASLTFAPIRTK